MWKLTISMGVVMITAAIAMATEPGEPKELSGMAIVGNDDAPKSLYIVPWKGSEIGMETTLARMLNAGAAPVDREVFRRELDFYQVSADNRTPPGSRGASIARAGDKQDSQQYFSVSPNF